MYKTSLMAGVLLSSGVAMAAEDQASGNYWKSLCEQAQNDYACAYYINGLVDGLTLAITETSLVTRGDAHKVYGYCPPASVSVGDMKQVFKKYLDDHPKNRQYTGASLALDAWRKAWPCPK
ncbi:MAG TPA: Rap1a/Tai family immunity protein [Spongiibacteraceae bacterium]|nr:Rap1a/Tai family immunity protein [Spongiibacteraceae bacterium]